MSKKENFKRIEIIGKLIKLRLVSSQFNISKPLVKFEHLEIKFDTHYEIGLKRDPTDEYFVSVSIKALGKEKANSSDISCKAECTMTGLYKLDVPFSGERNSLGKRILDRAALQLYPVARYHLMNLLSMNGIDLHDEILESEVGDIKEKDQNKEAV